MPGAYLSIFFALFFVAASYALDYDLFVDDPRIVYSPAQPFSSKDCSFKLTFREACTDNWWHLKDGVPSPSATVVTWGPSASLEFNFTGTSIELYGRTIPRGAGFYAGVDDLPMQWYNSSSAKKDFEILLFQSPQLSSGQHTVRLQYDPDTFSPDPQERVYLGLDVWTVRGAPESDGSEPVAQDGATPMATGSDKTDKSTSRTDVLGLGDISELDNPSGTRSGSRGGLSPAAVGALIAILVITVLLLSITGLVFYQRRKRIAASKIRTAALGVYAFGGPQGKPMVQVDNAEVKPHLARSQRPGVQAISIAPSSKQSDSSESWSHPAPV